MRRLTGAFTMLKREQRDTLQKAVYDSAWFDRLLHAIKVERLSPGAHAVRGFVRLRLLCSKPCRRFRRIFRLPQNFNDRWPFAMASANKSVQLSSDAAT